DTIISGGENVAPAEVEAVLVEHPAVAEAAVHARPDDEWGEAVVATVVLRADASVTADELRAHAAERLAPFKVPKAIAFRDALPAAPSSRMSSSRPSRPRKPSSVRASMRPSVKKVAMSPSPSTTVVWRRPVGRPHPSAGDEHVETGSCSAAPMMRGAGWPAQA